MDLLADSQNPGYTFPESFASGKFWYLNKPVCRSLSFQCFCMNPKARSRDTISSEHFFVRFLLTRSATTPACRLSIVLTISVQNSAEKGTQDFRDLVGSGSQIMDFLSQTSKFQTFLTLRVFNRFWIGWKF